MGRLVNGVRTIDNPRPRHIGKLLIFCEGSTEFNYFSYLNNYLIHNVKARYSEIIIEQIETINTKGNAQNVFNYAEEYLGDQTNAQKYSLYEKHLVFDCDAPNDIQSVLKQMRESPNEYVLDYTCLLFETWLLMHIQVLDPTVELKKRTVYGYMRDFLEVPQYNSKVKAAPGTIASILGTDGNARVRAAITNAKTINNFWRDKGLSYDDNVKKMNPSTNLDKVVEDILDEIDSICK